MAHPSRLKGLEGAEQRLGVGEALGLGLLQAAIHDLHQPLRHVGGHRAEGGRRGGQVSDDRQVGASEALEGVHAGEQLVQEHPDRPQVGAWIDGVHAPLLG